MPNTKVILSLVIFIAMASTVVRGQTVTDIDGNVYNTVNIYGQVWMAENLRTKRYNDSTNIPLVMDNETWKAATPAYCWYNNSEWDNEYTYGALYNWYAINTNKLCPTGWHVSTKEDWQILLNHSGYDGLKLKERGTTHWRDPISNKVATNSSGFTALPGGYRQQSGKFSSIGSLGIWWAAPVNSVSIPWFNRMWTLPIGTTSSIFVTNIFRHEKRGFSIRCIKD